MPGAFDGKPTRRAVRAASTTAPGEERSSVLPFVALVIAGALIHATVFFTYPLPLGDGNLIGPDSYMQVIRLREWIAADDWHYNAVARMNAPYGEVSHWTKPFMLLLFMLATPLRLFLDLEASTYWAAILIAPVLHIALSLVTAWAARPLLGRACVWTMPIVLLSFPIFAQATPGRADHHIALFLAFMVAFGMTVHLVMRARTLRFAFATGAAQAVGLWFSVELACLLVVALGCGVLWWILDSGTPDHRRRIARLNLWFCIGLSVATAIALVLERPVGDLANATIDEISIAYLLAAALAVIFWQGVLTLGRLRPSLVTMPGRVAAAAAGGLASVLVLAGTFPSLLSGPLVDVSPLTMRFFLGTQAEYVPALSLSPGMFIAFFGSAVMAIPVLCWILVRERSNASAIGWIFVSATMALYLLIALKYARFGPYAASIAALPLAYAFAILVSYSRRTMKLLVGIPVRAATAVLIFIGPNLLAFVAPLLAAAGQPSQETRPVDMAGCPVREIAGALNALPGDRIILSPYVYTGPEILFFNRHSVVAGPYHRSTSAIEDTYHIMTDTTGHDAKRLIAKRGVGLILICTARTVDALQETAAGMETLYTRLRNDRPPDWLQRVALPPHAEDKFRLYAVRAPKR